MPAEAGRRDGPLGRRPSSRKLRQSDHAEHDHDRVEQDPALNGQSIDPLWKTEVDQDQGRSHGQCRKTRKPVPAS